MVMQNKAGKHAHDLEKLLDQAMDIIKTSKDYQRPTISWTKEYATTHFAEYQYGINHIFVSRVLDTEEISKNELLSIVCHEVQHQEFVSEEENEEALSKIIDYPVYKKHVKAVEDFVDKNGDVEWISGRHLLGFDGDLLVCIIPFERQETAYENYGNYIHICPRKIAVDVIGKTMGVFPLVVFLTEYKGDFWFLGWCQNACVYSVPQKIRHKKFGTYDVTYQIKCRHEDFYRLPPIGCWIAVDDATKDIAEINEMILTLKRSGAAVLEGKNVFTEYCLKVIDEYPNDFAPIGMSIDQLYNLSPWLESDPIKLIKKSKDLLEKSSFRSVWLANKAVSISEKYETLLNQAQVLQYASFNGEALIAFKKALALRPDDFEAKLGYLQTLIMLDRNDEALIIAHSMKGNNAKMDKLNKNDFVQCLKYLKL